MRDVRISVPTSPIVVKEEQLGEMARHCETERDILALYLYGSYGTPYQTALSDVDLAVLPMPGAKWDWRRELEVQDSLSGMGGSDDINVVNLRAVPVTLQFRVLETGRILYVRDPTSLADFVEEVIIRHADIAPDLEVFRREYDLALREEFL